MISSIFTLPGLILLIIVVIIWRLFANRSQEETPDPVTGGYDMVSMVKGSGRDD